MNRTKSVCHFVIVVIFLLLMSTAQEQVYHDEAPLPDDKCTFPIGEEIRGEHEYIGIIFTNCPKSFEAYGILAAAKRWSEIVLSSGLSKPARIFSYPGSDEICHFFDYHPLFLNTTGDHLIILIEFKETLGGATTTAAPCLTGDGFFTLFGGIQVARDAFSYQRPNDMKNVILHELGHVLGLHWKLLTKTKQGGGYTSQPSESLLQNVVHVGEGIRIGNKPFFRGTNAAAKYSEENNIIQGFIWMEDGFTTEEGRERPMFDFLNGEGIAALDSHWKRDIFGDELMTYIYDTKTEVHPISRITILALKDLGYTVDVSKADENPVNRNRLHGREANPSKSDYIIFDCDGSDWVTKDIRESSLFIE